MQNPRWVSLTISREASALARRSASQTLKRPKARSGAGDTLADLAVAVLRLEDAVELGLRQGQRLTLLWVQLRQALDFAERCDDVGVGGLKSLQITAAEAPVLPVARHGHGELDIFEQLGDFRWLGHGR